ncbi:copper resistance protein CopC [Mesorhizobium sp. Root552]|uniref:copper resistance CopC/CopD family protein n=1 Tax=Mesorhizobium sp. Root552 TaxID=1736555 RepID=UPI0006F44088|nr:CopD family protein [Mesorhizobium sp. Root552]KQZ33463.1 copper resistance protein CopC [Mesorhizobium sp. Root552]
MIRQKRPSALSMSPVQALCWLLASLLLSAVILAPNPAAAHAALIKAEPADGTVIATSPSAFSLTFSEPVSPLVLTLLQPDGSSLALTSSRLDSQTVVIANPQPLASGTHVLSWRVVSEDGHPVAGSLLFSVGAPSAAPQPAEPVDWLVRSLLWSAKVALYIGLFLGIGGAFAIAWLAKGGREGQRFVVAALLAGLLAAPASLGLQGLDALGARLHGIVLPAVWETGFATSFGWTVLVALAALAAALLGLVLPRLGRPLTLLALAGAGAALAASGHASAADPQWLTRPMVFLHGVAIAFWAGALVPLGLALWRKTSMAGIFLRRFSRSVLPVFAILVGAGVVLAVIQVEKPSALIDTAYGRLLVAKLALLAVLFALAAFNRWRLTAPAGSGDAPARTRLARSISVEILLAVLIFGVAAGWRFTPPPRALAIAAAQPAIAHFHTPQAMAELTITPGHTGEVAASILMFDGDFGPLDAKEVTLVLSKPDSGIEPLKRPATKPGDGTWRVDNLVIPIAGSWNARIDILVSDFEMTKVEGPIDIRP